MKKDIRNLDAMLHMYKNLTETQSTKSKLKVEQTALRINKRYITP